MKQSEAVQWQIRLWECHQYRCLWTNGTPASKTSQLGLIASCFSCFRPACLAHPRLTQACSKARWHRLGCLGQLLEGAWGCVNSGLSPHSPFRQLASTWVIFLDLPNTHLELRAGRGWWDQEGSWVLSKEGFAGSQA